MKGGDDRAQFRVLSRTEGAALRFAGFCTRRWPWLSMVVSFFPMGALVWAGISRRLHVRGLEHLHGLPPNSPILLVANHRSFFDFFVVLVTLRIRAGFRHRVYFPVRADFFYSHPLGVLVNLVGAGMSMYPPVFRTGPKRALNRWSLDECAGILSRPGTAVGVHPEGTRGSGSDPFTLLPARPGAGRIAMAAPTARVLPVFVLGLGNRIPGEIIRNLTAPGRHPIWVAFGPEVDLSDLRVTPGARAFRIASERCRSAIQAVGEQLRRETAACDD
jgi:1-acyl-sn-glycerol-3-phosphate acyltransferase